MCSEAFRGDISLETLKSCRDKVKVVKLATMPEDRYPKHLFFQEWNVKQRRTGTAGVEYSNFWNLLSLSESEFMKN